MIEDVKSMCLNSQQALDIATSAAKFSTEDIETTIMLSSAVSIAAFLFGMFCSEAIRIIRHRALFYKKISGNCQGINLIKNS